MTEKLVSVIVPVYKVEQYLNSCIKSLINQTYHNMEIILVDDGSPDSCGDMCDLFAKQDNRIVVIHKENGGLSDARNAGLEICTGEYITFVDSDDLVSKKYIEILVGLVEQGADISVCSPRLFQKDEELSKKVEVNIQIDTFSPVEALSELLLQHKFEPSAWGKIYKADLFRNLRFPFGKTYEDLATSYIAVDNSQKIIRTTEQLYFYRQRLGSQLNTSFNEKFLDILEISNEMQRYIVRKYPELEIEANARVVSAYCHILIRLPKDKRWKDMRSQIYNRVKQLRKGQLFYKGIRLENKLTIVFSYLGKSVFLFMMNLLKVFNK